MNLSFRLALGLQVLCVAGLSSAQEQPPQPQVAQAPQPQVAQPPQPVAATPPAAVPDPPPVDAAAAALQKAAEKLDAASKKLDAAAGKLAPASADATELFSGRAPWNGFALKLAEKDKKAIVGASGPLDDGRFTLTGELTVPLDEETRRAPLLDARGRPSPFQLKLSLERNFVAEELQDFLNTNPSAQALQEACRLYLGQPGKPGSMCPSDDFWRWMRDEPELARQLFPDLAPHAPEGVFSRRVPMGMRFSFGLELAGSFDRQDVYESDVAAEAVAKSKWEFTPNLVGRYYPTMSVAIPVRVGATVGDGYKAKEFDRCKTLTSSDTAVTGKQCAKALMLESDDSVELTAFIDAAVVYVPQASDSWDLQPGVEARARLDGLGATKLAHVYGTLFVAPTDRPIALRLGAGFEYVYAIDGDTGSSPSFGAGDTWVIPFVLAGGSL
ncbi:hypothetical protein [Sorangium sp. So ce394]|uniref:hypothetical protein n=1 Tax=Sorangium sp. So ce394 TaxID=3133310 RepID=UPI003F5B8DB9